MLTFEKLKSQLTEGNFEGIEDCRTLSDLVEKFVGDDEIIDFYPKGLFVNQRVEFYIFKRDCVLVFSTNRIHSAIKSFKYKDLLAVEYVQSENDGRKRSIDIKFSDETLHLESFADTNYTWSDRFGETISRVFKLLS
ncbi:DUF3908 family protein [Brevibacillus reuszeri]|uniref:DUF3908 family protein n=1 Tax=Brevibacillus reuszeri TaxID=54915 RepID=UPI000CCBDC83|nr:DUF3908 family protein [Brevibacillus reuszeri]